MGLGAACSWGGGVFLLMGGVGTMSLTPGPRVGVGGTEPGWSITQQEGFPFLLLLFCFFLPFPPPLPPSPLSNPFALFPSLIKALFVAPGTFRRFHNTGGARSRGSPDLCNPPGRGGKRGVGRSSGFCRGGDIGGQRLQRGSVGSLPPSAARCRCGDFPPSDEFPPSKSDRTFRLLQLNPIPPFALSSSNRVRRSLSVFFSFLLYRLS